MFIRPAALLISALIIVISAAAQAGHLQLQDSLLSSRTVSTQYLDKISAKADQVQQKLDKKSQKALQQWQRQEAKIQRKLAGIDSLKAKQIFANAGQQYKQLEQKLQQTGNLKQYIPSLDTLATSLKFLQQNPQLLSQTKEAQQKLTEALGKVKGLEGQFGKAEEVKKFLQYRQQYLKEQISGLGTRISGQFGGQFKHLSKQAYYYNEQVKQYKALLKDHKKAEKKALALLSKTKLFKDFMRKSSQLAALFRLPGDPNDPTAQASLAGLQTRAQVSNLIQQQIAAGGPNARQQFQQNLQEAQGQLSQLKNKLNQLGKGGSTEDIMPEGFKPNDQKTKSFLKRLELGTNIQSQKASGYFPTTSDIGLSVGYKLNDKSIIGIGASYKLGWGKDIKHINITHQGAGLRSFVDWKVKGSWWMSGGYEMNYRSEFNQVEQLKNLNSWQQSGLVGISKVVSLKTKFFKKTKLQLLWDFMSYDQVPKAQPIVFRIGYAWR
jgi:hypothetical protein